MTDSGRKAAVGKRAAATAGILLILVGGLALLQWEEILARYHLLRVRSDTGYLRNLLLLEPPSLAGRVALDRYLQDQRGKEEFASFYLHTMEDRVRGALDLRGAMVLVQDELFRVVQDGRQSGGRCWTLESTQNDRLIRSAQPFLERLKGRTFRFERFAGYSFLFLAGDEASESFPFWVSIRSGSTQFAWGIRGQVVPPWFSSHDRDVLGGSTTLFIESVDGG